MLTETERAQVRDWYDTHPSNTREPRPGTPTVAAMQAESMARQVAERVAAWQTYRGDGSDAPERVYFKNRSWFRAEAARQHRRNCDGATLQKVTPAFNAIRTPWHGYSDAALKIERNARKRDRQQRRAA